jgi:2-oxoglutarate/2-oxoacid ferredoxin oxidoreductase subunit beta
MLAEMTFPEFPTPIGVLRKVEKPTYDAQINQQVDAAIDQRDGKADLQELINGAHTWTV